VITQQIVNGITLGSVYATIAAALTLSIGVLKFLNFSIPGLFMLGGMLTWFLIHIGFPLPIAALATLACTAIFSVLVERFTWRWLHEAEHFVPLVSSMAFLLLFEHAAVNAWGSDAQVLPVDVALPDWQIAGLVIGAAQLIGLICSVTLISGLSYLLKYTRTGRALRTIAENPETGLLLGVDIGRLVLAVFVIAGAYAAFAGILFALNYRQVHPFIGDAVGLKGISAMIVGGMGNIWGSIIGGLIVGLTEVMAITYLGAGFVDIAVFGLLLFTLWFRPSGLFGGTTATRANL